MATVIGVQATKIAASPLQLAEQGYASSRIKVISDSYTLLADASASDVITMGQKLPEGSRILRAVIEAGALGGSCTLDLGWGAGYAADGVTVAEAASAQAIFAALPASSAVTADSVGSSYEGTVYQGKVLAAEVQPQIKFHAASSGATGKVIRMDIYFVAD